MRTQHQKTVKELHSDNGKEFLNRALQSYLNDCGTIQTTTTAYTPQHNGIVERMNRTLMNTTRALLHTAQAPPIFWADALAHAALIHNARARKALNGQSPFQVLNNAAADSSNLRVWGCDVSVMVHSHKQTKLGSRVWKGMFIGSSEQAPSGWRIYDCHKHSVIVTRDVQFHESDFTQSHIAMDEWKASLDGDDSDTTYSSDADWSTALDYESISVPTSNSPTQQSSSTSDSASPSTDLQSDASIDSDSQSIIDLVENASNADTSIDAQSPEVNDLSQQHSGSTHSMSGNNNQHVSTNASDAGSNTYDAGDSANDLEQESKYEDIALDDSVINVAII